MTQRLQHLMIAANELNVKKDIKLQYCDHSSTE